MPPSFSLIRLSYSCLTTGTVGTSWDVKHTGRSLFGQPSLVNSTAAPLIGAAVRQTVRPAPEMQIAAVHGTGGRAKSHYAVAPLEGTDKAGKAPDFGALFINSYRWYASSSGLCPSPSEVFVLELYEVEGPEERFVVGLQLLDHLFCRPPATVSVCLFPAGGDVRCLVSRRAPGQRSLRRWPVVERGEGVGGGGSRFQVVHSVPAPGTRSRR